MTARRLRSATVVRSIGSVPDRGSAPGSGLQSAPARGDRYVALDPMREQIDRVEWAPLRLAGAGRARPASPRLLHALLLHLAHAGRLAAGRDGALAGASLADVPVALDVGTLAGLVGTDEDVVAAALRALLQGGALQGGAQQSVGRAASGALPPAVTLTPALLGPAPRCAALDWGGLALATAGAPSAWVAAHVLAERLVLDEWTPMPRSALERTLGCGVSGVRSALDRLTAAAVVERREQRGGVSAYRFSSALRAPAAPGAPGQGGEALPQALRAVPPAPVVTTQPASVAAPATAVAAAGAAGSATGVRLTVGGVELDVPPGLRVRVEIGPDGMPQITLVPAAAPPS